MKYPIPSGRKAFTLIELLVVIAIIAILAAILFPVFAQAKMAAKKTGDLSSQKQIVIAEMMYADDNSDVHSFAWGWDTDWIPWHKAIDPYVKNKTMWMSPGDPFDHGMDAVNNKVKAIPVTYSQNFCWPHSGWGWAASDPQYLMSPAGASSSSVSQAATTIFMAPRPNGYHQWNAGWATEVFFDYEEFIDFSKTHDANPTKNDGSGSRMFNGGCNYGFCDGHAKFFKLAETRKPQGNQPTTLAQVPALEKVVFPAGMWDKRQ